MAQILKLRDRVFEEIIGGYVDGMRHLAPHWYQSKRGKPIKSPAFHYEIQDHLLKKSKDGLYAHKFVAFRAPRDHAKSTSVTKGYSTWHSITSACIHREPESILIVSARQQEAYNWFDDIVNVLRNSKVLRQYFGPVTKGSRWGLSRGDVTLRFANGIEHRYVAGGALMDLRGDQFRSLRPTLVVLDDITRDKESLNAESRKRRVDWVLATVVPMIDREGRVINVGTPRPFLDDWNSGVIEKLAERTRGLGREGWTLHTWQAIPHLDDPARPVLWPERYSRESLLNLKQSFAFIGREWLWWCEYQCVPTSEGQREFDVAWYRGNRWSGELVKTAIGPYLETEQHGRVAVATAVGVDPAFSKERAADKACIAGWGMSKDENFWQIDQVARQGMDGEEIIREALAMAQRIQAGAIVFEKAGQQQTLSEWAKNYQDEQRRAGKLLHYALIAERVPGVQSKAERIKAAMQPAYASGRVHHKEGLYHGIENELENFRGVHPDILDAGYYAWCELRPAVHEAPSKEAKDEDEVPVGYDWMTGEPLYHGEQVYA